MSGGPRNGIAVEMRPLAAIGLSQRRRFECLETIDSVTLGCEAVAQGTARANAPLMSDSGKYAPGGTDDTAVRLSSFTRQKPGGYIGAPVESPQRRSRGPLTAAVTSARGSLVRGASKSPGPGAYDV